jgi:ABC-2 type transport system permease protein
MIDLAAAEWLKLRTTRLLAGTLPVAVGLSVAAVAGMVLSTHASPLASPDEVRRILSAAGAGAIVLLVVGILIAAGEHRHGTMADTYLTTPTRAPVIVAKLLVAGSLGAVVGIVAAVACVITGIAVAPTRDVSLPLDSADVWLALPATALYAGLFAVIGVAIGTLARNQVAAIAGALGWIAIVEHTLVNLVPSAGRWLPAGAGQAILRTPIDGLLDPPVAAAVLVAYAALAAAAAILIESNRDV